MRARITADEILFVDSEESDEAKLAKLAGKATSHGTFTCKQLLAFIWMWSTIATLKNVKSTKVADLLKLAGRPIAPKGEDALAGALLARATGTFRAETGESKAASWLRFVRT